MNVDFLISAFVVLLFLFYHFIGKKKILTKGNRIFRSFMLLAIADVLFDLFSTCLIVMNNVKLAVLTMLVMTLFYMMQALIPYMFLCYIESLKNISREKLKCIIFLGVIPTTLMEILILSNLVNHLFFYIDNTGAYIRGPYYMYMYYYTFLYVFVAAVGSIVHYRKLGPDKFRIIWEILLIAGVCIAIQAYDHNLMMTGFGLCLGTMVLFFTLHNPYEYYDNLTGAFAKTYFDRWIQEELHIDRQVHFLSADIYQLKQINKIFGTSTGDQLLIHVKEKILELTPCQCVFRITGNRFLMPVFSLADYEKMREKLQKLFQNPFWINGEEILCPAIICGIFHGESFENSDSLLSYIEYLSQLLTANQGTVLIQGDEHTQEGFWNEQEIERYLNTAIEEDLFDVYYQPVYSIKSKKYVTLEALSRLYHPSIGFISPDVFIGIAEKNGQIGEIGCLQMHRICRFVKEHEELMDQIQNIKINLSPAEILKQGHSTKLIEIIRFYDLPSSFFQFEITETVATEYSENLYQAVEEFTQEGISMCLDDFGSGYANLNTVLKLPFSAIKLDRSLLNGITEENQIALFYKSIVSVLKNMGYYVISEGVEKKEDVELLEKWGVDMIQGYYFSRPVPAGEILCILSRICEGTEQIHILEDQKKNG